MVIPTAVLIDFGTILSGILFVALPFVVLGVLISNLIQAFVSREKILSFYGQGFLRNYLVSVAAGFVFPVCECGIVPIARGLSKQGVPTSAIVMFLLSAPVFNPITMGATLAAFPARPGVWIWRLLIAQFLTLTIGWIFQAYRNKNDEPLPILAGSGLAAPCVHGNGESRLHKFLTSSFEEFSQVFPYILLGATITSLFQEIIPKGFFTTMGAQPLLAIPFFMLFALILSVCSSVDAFVILPFANKIPFSALLAFLNYGPLIDIKNILLFRAYFTPKFQHWYFGLVTLCVALVAFLLWFVFPGYLSV